MINNSYSFLVVGKTNESTTTQEFKQYVGLGDSFVIAVNPTKSELETIYGREMANDPEYVVDTDNGKEARITFVVRTNPETCNGIEITNRVMITLRNAPAYNKDKSKVQVMDDYGNATWANTEDAKAGKKLFSSNGTPLKIDSTYHICCVGEADLVGFLKSYLRVYGAFDYVNGAWIKKENAQDYMFKLENIKNYFSGDFSEIKDAIAYQKNNEVKLLYGVRTTEEGKKYTAIATRYGMVLMNNANSSAIEKLSKELVSAKEAGSFSNIEFGIHELKEYAVEPTNFETPIEAPVEDEMPWD